MKPGIYDNIPNAAYHGGPGISKSGLDLVHRSPAHLNAVLTSANDRTPTPAQELGTAVHMAILEPAEFAKTYCLPLRRSDVPDAIDDREVLVAMISKLNETRLAKLPTSGSKAELIERIKQAQTESNLPADVLLSDDRLNAMKGAELKNELDGFNNLRPGLLPVSGSRNELAEILRANGQPVTLWSDVYDEWQRNNCERKILSPETYDQILAMREAVMKHPAAFAILNRVKDIIGDLKTTEDASPEGFAKSIANYRYDVQHAYYMDGTRLAIEQGQCTPPQEGTAELSVYWTDPLTGVLCRCRPDFWRGYPKHFAFIAVEKKPPYAVGVYVLDSDGVDIGRAQYQQDLKVYAECLRKNEWPGYGDKIQTISLPAWHANKNAHLLESA